MLTILNSAGRKTMALAALFLCLTIGAVAAGSSSHIQHSIESDADWDEAVSLLQLSGHATFGNLGASSKEMVNSSKAAGPDAYTEWEDWWAYYNCDMKNALEKSNLAARKPVLWVHIHKSAGTSMCCEARRREKVVSPSLNCNSGDDDWQKWVKAIPGPFKTCEERSAIYQRQGFTWGATERWLEPGDFCPKHFVYATILRDPFNTMLSAINDKNLQIPASDRMSFLRRDVIACIRAKACAQSGLIWYVFDNFMVRTLSGAGFSVPPGGINATHFKAAVQMLRKFHLVILMEHVNDPRAVKAYDEVIGWPLPLQEFSPTNHANQGHDKVTWDPNTQQQLRNINAFDVQLYDFAKQTYYP